MDNILIYIYIYINIIKIRNIKKEKSIIRNKNK